MFPTNRYTFIASIHKPMPYRIVLSAHDVFWTVWDLPRAPRTTFRTAEHLLSNQSVVSLGV